MTDYPIFSLAPDWSNSNLTETFEWMTRVYQSKSGAEQRAQVRPVPRRYYEMDFMVYGPTQSFYTTFVRKFGAQDFLIPLWPLQDTLAETMSAGDVVATLLSEPYSEIRSGTQVIFWRSFTDYLVLDVTGVNGSVITFAAAPGQVLTPDYKLYPLRLARFTDTTKLTRVGDRMLTGSAKVVLRQGEPVIGSVLSDDQYLGFGVLSEAPDENQTIQVGFDTMVDTKSSAAARDFFTDTAGFSFATQQNTYFIVGKDERNKFLARLAGLNGQLVPVWLPSFAMDFDLVADIAADDTVLKIGPCNFTALGGPTQGVNVLRIEKYDGTSLYRAILTSSQPSVDYEQITLGSPIGADLLIGDVKRLSFMVLSRLSADSVEIVYQTDGEGLSLATLSFRAAPDLRKATAWTPYDPCGDNPLPTDEYTWSYTSSVTHKYVEGEAHTTNTYETPADGQKVTTPGLTWSSSTNYQTGPFSYSISYNAFANLANDYANYGGIGDGNISAIDAFPPDETPDVPVYDGFAFGVKPWQEKDAGAFIDLSTGQLFTDSAKTIPLGVVAGMNVQNIVFTGGTISLPQTIVLNLAVNHNLRSGDTGQVPAYVNWYCNLGQFQGTTADGAGYYVIGASYSGEYDPNQIGVGQPGTADDHHPPASVSLSVDYYTTAGSTGIGQQQVLLVPTSDKMPPSNLAITYDISNSGVTLTVKSSDLTVDQTLTIPVDLSHATAWQIQTVPYGHLSPFFNYSADLTHTATPNFSVTPIVYVPYILNFYYEIMYGYYTDADALNAAALNNNWGIAASQTANGCGLLLSVPKEKNEFDVADPNYGGTVFIGFSNKDAFTKEATGSTIFTFPTIPVPQYLDADFDPTITYTAALAVPLSDGSAVQIYYTMTTKYERGANTTSGTPISGLNSTGSFKVLVYTADGQSLEHDLAFTPMYTGTISIDISNTGYTVLLNGATVFTGNDANVSSGAIGIEFEAAAVIPLYIPGTINVNFTTNMN